MSEQNPEGYSNKEISRTNIENEKLIKLVDTDENGLDLFSYIQCDSSSSELIKESRGIVFNGDKIVFKGFSYTYELSEHENYDEIVSKVDFNTCSFYESHEGAIIRMFYFNDKWYLSTNRKLDAFRSKWASKESFGKYFKDALVYQFENNERIKEKVSHHPYNEWSDDEKENIINIFSEEFLDKSKQYMFLLLNSLENRIVCDPPTHPSVYHVGTFFNGELSMIDDILIPYPKKHEFTSFDKLFEYINNQDYHQSQGIVVFAPNNVQYKIFNRDYLYLYRVRGNEPSIKFRYLQVRKVDDSKVALVFLYPEFVEHFEKYENYILQVAELITKAYIERYIKKNYVTIPTEEYKVMSNCHKWHTENRDENKINLNKVLEFLNLEQATSLNKMIKRRIQEERDSSKTNYKVDDMSDRKRVNKGGESTYISILTNKQIKR